MLEFRELTLDDVGLVAEYLPYARSRLCDISLGCLFMWRGFFKTRIAEHEGSLFIKFIPFDNLGTIHYLPLTRDLASAARIAARDMKEHGAPARFSAVSKQELEALRSVITVERVETWRNWYDYLYNARDLAQMSGRRYAGQRNHIHRFEKAYPNAEFLPYSPEHRQAVLRFIERYYAAHGEQNDMGTEERRRLPETLDNLARLRLFADVLMTGGEVAALSIGEILGDTLFVHTEKADISYPGAYQTIVRLFAAAHTDEKVCYVNREEDMGIVGLRVSKESYHPAALLEKYTVYVGET
jgi:hypothetical protein